MIGALLLALSVPLQGVDPFIGTSGLGSTYPGVSCPFGLVQVSPDTGAGQGWYWSGYQKKDHRIYGFSHTHMSGIGGRGLGDILLQPLRGGCTDPLLREPKSDEVAEVGYYSVTYEKTGIRAEVTASPHAAIHRYTYLKGGAGHVLVDLKHGLSQKPGSPDTENYLKSCEVTFGDDNRTITGSRRVRDFIAHEVFFRIEFDRPFKAVRPCAPFGPKDAGKRYLCDFDVKEGDVIRAKVAISAKGVPAAEANLAAEIPDWDFDRVRRACVGAWDALLGRVELEGSDEAVRKAFYTALYHLYLHPNVLSDVGEPVRYTGFSTWDTFRAAHPLYTILAPERVQGIVDSMLACQRRRGFLPIWEAFGYENQCMIGNHAVPVVVDAYLKGLWKGDAEALFDAVTNSVRGSHRRVKENWEYLDSHGYYPYDGEGIYVDDRGRQESVSRLLECAYDDACAARLAKALGKADAARCFERASHNWTNVFDRATGLMRGRDREGRWRTPFDPLEYGRNATTAGDYTEANAWQYTWHVMQHPEELIAAMGGAEAFVRRLDEFFATSDAVRRTDVVHRIGQYEQGNEPGHHVPYFYALAGRPDRTAELVREICRTCYTAAPDGLCGNDDCGQMSAWYVFSVMGFYPFDPCGGLYVLGAPQVGKVRVKVGGEGGREAWFTVVAKDLSEANRYVARVTLNGKPVEGPFLRHADVVKGGTLVFEMTDRAR